MALNMLLDELGKLEQKVLLGDVTCMVNNRKAG
jgi:hypothetical protein